MIYFIGYLILGIPLIIFLIQFRHGKLEDKQQYISGVLAIFLFGYFILHSGFISKYIVKFGNKEYYISPYALNTLITKNIDNLAQAISQVYEKIIEIEVFDLTKESERVTYTSNDKGNFVVKLRLKDKPIQKTIRVEASSGNFNLDPEQPIFLVDENNRISIQFLTKPEVAKPYIENEHLYFSVTYFRE
jgi:hypothetical protein